MGNRAQVHIKDEGVYLYTHWEATELIDKVKVALKKKWRWDDPEYLTRIIFDCMTEGQHGEETGFGIGSGKHEDIWRLITINCKSQTVTITDDGEPKITQSFTEFMA